MPTHKKGHDKDKYYYLAKDQGYRSRAAYKLIQINKRFDFLSKAKVCLDLCAAPGGWCQVAEKNMPAGSIVIGVDLLPIRPIKNVKTIVNDITTSECRKQIQAEMQGWKADVVLCDGAPNIGSAYNKDAYVQNELVIAALKTATDHLNKGGTFCTKVYRSVDYNAIVWVLQQLFEDVQTMKPNSSRSQSSEIFLVCMNYTAPKHIDPKLLDPNCVFKEVSDPGLKKVDVLHKKYEKLNKRHRTGYEDHLGILLSQRVTVSHFLASPDPVQILTDANELVFSEECQIYATHESTTPELMMCFKDLRVLGKIDFKKILKWRQALRAEFNIAKSNDSDDSEENIPKEVKEPQKELSEEELIQEEIENLQSSTLHKLKKDKKKQREEMSKMRKRHDIGMSNNAFEEGQDIDLFSMSKTLHLLKKYENKDNNLTNTSDANHDDDNDEEDDDEDLEVEDDEFLGGHRGPLTAEEEEELENAQYAEGMYSTTEEGIEAKEGAEAINRPPVARKDYPVDVTDEDVYELDALEDELEYDYKRYIHRRKERDLEVEAYENKKQLQNQHNQKKRKIKDTSNDILEMELGEDDNDDNKKDKLIDSLDKKTDFIDHHHTGKHIAEIVQAKVKAKSTKNTLTSSSSDIHVPKNASDIWFSNPIFQNDDNAIDFSTNSLTTAMSDDDEDDDVEEEEDDNTREVEKSSKLMDNINKKVSKKEDVSDNKTQDKTTTTTTTNSVSNKNTSTSNKKKSAITTEIILPEMPKTDKQLRKEKRKKEQERNLKKQLRRAERDAPTEDEESYLQDTMKYHHDIKKQQNKRQDGDDEYEGGGGSNNNNNSNSNNNKSSGSNNDKVLSEKDLNRLRLIEKGMGKKKRTATSLLGDDMDKEGFEIVPRDMEDMSAGYTTGGAYSDDDDDDNNKHRKQRRVSLNDDSDDDTDSDSDDNGGDNIQDHYLQTGKKNRLQSSLGDKKATAENRVMTLALGTLMLNSTRKKSLIDASYNRYSWNDQDELPSWFLEDEMRHNKPQVPVPSALIDQIKGRFQLTGTKEIKKVAEARARKRKRALTKLKSAKKKANAMAESTDMSQREKMKAISRAMRESQIKKPGKVYVMTKKTGGASSGTKASNAKGKLKFVDKRLKKDKRADRVNKRRAKK